MQVLKTKRAKQRAESLEALFHLYEISVDHLRMARFRSHWQPYHNYQHGYAVALAAAEAAIAEGLPQAQIKHLLLAGLYHDYRHTADYRLDDHENLRRAFHGAKVWMRIFRHNLRRQDRQRVLELIVLTEANTTRKIPHQLAVHVLLDAVKLAHLDADADLWIEALAREERLPITAATLYEELSKAKIYTAWGRNRLREFRDRYGFAGGGLTEEERARVEARLVAEATAPQPASEVDAWLRRQQRYARN